ncbi:hypothetical protein LTR17_022277 [Elasticomyces elasticus]|nr:hypothetical protein LTR17_022277 [Elasticomyces elasticus]
MKFSAIATAATSLLATTTSAAAIQKRDGLSQTDADTLKSAVFACAQFLNLDDLATTALGHEIDEKNPKSAIEAILCNGGCIGDFWDAPNAIGAPFQNVVRQLTDLTGTDGSNAGNAQIDIDRIDRGILVIVEGRCAVVLPSIDKYFAAALAAIQGPFLAKTTLSASRRLRRKLAIFFESRREFYCEFGAEGLVMSLLEVLNELFFLEFGRGFRAGAWYILCA